jgi:hypothetical protein
MSMRLGISKRCRPEPKDFFSDGTRRFGTTIRRFAAFWLSEVLVEAFVVKRRSPPHPSHRHIRPRADSHWAVEDNGSEAARRLAKAPRSSAVIKDYIPRRRCNDAPYGELAVGEVTARSVKPDCAPRNFRVYAR